GARGASSMPATVSCWARRRARHLQRRDLAAHCAAADAVAAVLSGYARLVRSLACLSARLWLATGCPWRTAHSQRLAAVETRASSRSACDRGALLLDRANRHPSPPHRSARSDHRQCACSGLAPQRS
ncbi:MAG: hypothetical protein ACXWPG_15430, partial [Ktedonobacteraceae bacterium]